MLQTMSNHILTYFEKGNNIFQSSFELKLHPRPTFDSRFQF